MYGRRIRGWLGGALVLAAGAGCCGARPCSQAAFRPVPTPLPAAPCRPGPAGLAPDALYPTTPAPAPAPPPGVTQGGYTPGLPEAPVWRPAAPAPTPEPPLSVPQVRLGGPELPPEDGDKAPPARARLAPPETPEPPMARAPEDRPKPMPPAPAAESLDIPQFAIARGQVANGLQPFPDGVAWLKEQGYRSVLHLRAPGEDDAAARRLYERQGLRYESLELSPRTLDKDFVERLNRLVADPGRLPLFVYDKDGSLSGAMWYLHYRIAVGMDDAKALAEAARLGFKPESEAHRAMLLAAKAYLSAK